MLEGDGAIQIDPSFYWLPVRVAIFITIIFLIYLAISWLAGRRGRRLLIPIAIHVSIVGLILHDIVLSPFVFRHLCNTDGGLKGQPVPVGTGVFVEENVFRGCLEDCWRALGVDRAHFVEAESDPNRPAPLPRNWEEHPVLEPGFYRFTLDKESKCKGFVYFREEGIEYQKSMFIYHRFEPSGHSFFANIRKYRSEIRYKKDDAERISATSYILHPGWLSFFMQAMLPFEERAVASCYGSFSLSSFFDDNLGGE